MVRFYAGLLFVSMVHIACASQNLRIDTNQQITNCSGSQVLSRIFFNEVDVLSLAVIADVRLTKYSFASRYASLETQYHNLAPQLSEQAKKHAQNSLQSLKKSLENFDTIT